MAERLRKVEGKASWDWLAFAATLPSRAIQFRNQATNQILFNGRCIVTGLALNNSATIGGLITLHDGQDTTGSIITNLPYAASTGASQLVASQGVLTEIGVFAEISAGTISGAVWLIPLVHYNITPPGT